MLSSFESHEAKVALVTGAGRGLGRALVLELVARGMKVGALGRNAAPLESLAEEAGDAVLPLVADVSDPESLTAAFARLDGAMGPLDTLINNAAVYPHRDFLEETPETFMDTLHINLGGPLAASMLALARMVPRGTGRIVNVGTFAGRRPTQLAAAYSVSKGAGLILTKAMVADLADRFPDIVITDWIPGALNTTMGIPEGHDPAEAARWGAALALWHDQSLNGALFVEQVESLPEQSLKRQVFNKLTRQSVTPRRLDRG